MRLLPLCWITLTADLGHTGAPFHNLFEPVDLFSRQIHALEVGDSGVRR